jgi:aspartyl-tRNA(Asn)/glutamyl-tRNA(Gln) amidotransferase subunit B
MIANWIINKKADVSKVSPEELVKLITTKTQVVQMDQRELEALVKKVIEANQKAVSDYKAGKEASLMFLLGCVMRETKGKAEAQQVKKTLISSLASN